MVVTLYSVGMSVGLLAASVGGCSRSPHALPVSWPVWLPPTTRRIGLSEPSVPLLYRGLADERLPRSSTAFGWPFYRLRRTTEMACIVPCMVRQPNFIRMQRLASKRCSCRPYRRPRYG